jgi:hypothetical protein
MYTLFRNWRLREGLLEAFFKFHSFTLECACFLATWTALGAILSFATRGRLPADERA